MAILDNIQANAVTRLRAATYFDDITIITPQSDVIGSIDGDLAVAIENALTGQGEDNPDTKAGMAVTIFLTSASVAVERKGLIRLHAQVRCIITELPVVNRDATVGTLKNILDVAENIITTLQNASALPSIVPDLTVYRLGDPALLLMPGNPDRPTQLEYQVQFTVLVTLRK